MFDKYDIKLSIIICICLQGTPGEKGAKGDLGQPQIDVFQAVKVFFDCLFINT